MECGNTIITYVEPDTNMFDLQHYNYVQTFSTLGPLHNYADYKERVIVL